MIIGVPREIKDNEKRVGITPAGVKELVESNHSVIVQTAAGLGSGFTDNKYITTATLPPRKYTSPTIKIFLTIPR